MSARGEWQGMFTIVRLNWPFYVAASLVFVAACAALVVVPMTAVRVACVLAICGSGWFLVASLVVSHLVYDRSDLYRWQWLDRALRGTECLRFIFCHAGFDEASVSLREHLKPEKWTVLDHFDAALMTEASIRRARALFPPIEGTIAAPFDQWPQDPASVDAVFGLLAIHEFRDEAERTAWFGEARRCLPKGGRVLLVEHTRDRANFLAFGPGFLHFHSPTSWHRCWDNAGLRLRDEFRITPLVRVFVLEVP